MPTIDRRYLLAGLILLLMLAFWGGIKYRDLKEENPAQEMILSEAADKKETNDSAPEIQVYVVGEVKKPGLYKVKNGARVYEVLEMAEVLPTADLQSAQPARKLKDEETVTLYAQGQNPEASDPNNTGIKSAAKPSQLQVVSSASSGLLNINTASAQELDERLPGIGPALAQRIIDYRNSNGSFSCVEDINNVSGIGDKKFAAIKDLITVR